MKEKQGGRGRHEQLCSPNEVCAGGPSCQNGEHLLTAVGQQALIVCRAFIRKAMGF